MKLLCSFNQLQVCFQLKKKKSARGLLKPTTEMNENGILIGDWQPEANEKTVWRKLVEISVEAIFDLPSELLPFAQGKRLLCGRESKPIHRVLLPVHHC